MWVFNGKVVIWYVQLYPLVERFLRTFTIRLVPQRLPFFRSIGIPCSLYIDDRLTGEIMTGTGSWSVPPEARDKEYRYKAAMAALWCVLVVLAKLG